jgi:hypothetical protein
MRHVVAYVVADVVLVRALMSAFDGCRHGAFFTQPGPEPASRAAKKWAPGPDMQRLRTIKTAISRRRRWTAPLRHICMITQTVS